MSEPMFSAEEIAALRALAAERMAKDASHRALIGALERGDDEEVKRLRKAPRLFSKLARAMLLECSNPQRPACPEQTPPHPEPPE